MMIPNRDKEREYMFKKAEAETKMKNPKKVKMGKRSKAQGSAFEKKTREDLEAQGWSNNRKF